MRRRSALTRSVTVASALALVATILFTAIAPGNALANPAADPTDVNLTTEGASESGTVPDGVCRADVAVIGGGGGANFATSGSFPPNAVDHRGGDAASLTAQYELHPGQPYSASSGGGGGGAGDLDGGIGANGTGGSGSPTNFHQGAGGGGRSDVFLADLTTPALVAGGGGGSGGGHYGPGMDGGAAGVPAGTGAAAGADGVEGNDAGNVLLTGGGGGGIAAPGAGGVSGTNTAYNGFAGVGANGGNGGPGVGIDWAGGGGAGLFGGGGGSSTSTNGGNGSNNINGSNIGGSGGGGGSSYIQGVAIDGLATAPTTSASLVAAAGPGRSGWGGTGNPTAAQGADGLATIDFIPCNYDLQVTKTAAPAALLLGETITWTVTVTNVGPDEMTRGDLVTLTDSLPGSGATSVVSITHTPGAPSGLDQSPVTCDVAPGAAMAGTVTCSQPYASSTGVNVPAGGDRGLDVGGSIEIVYTQVAADLGCATNTAGVTDRADNGTASAEVCVSEEIDYMTVDKSVASGPTNNQDGTYDISYDIVVEVPTASPACTGTGLAPDYCVLKAQDNVQATDGLDATIAAAATSISSAVTAGTCTEPAVAYDGVANTSLLSGTDTITPGTSCTITVTMTVTSDPDAGIGTIPLGSDTTNTAGATSDATSATDTATTQFTENPSMAVGKSITAGPTSNQDGTYSLTYEVTAFNDGDVELRDLQIDDGLQTVFGAALVSGTATSVGCTDSTAPYDGVTNTALLTGTDTLAVGGTCTSTINVIVTVDSTVAGSAALNTDYTNSAAGSATSPSDAPVGDSATATTQFTENPSMDVAKSVGDPTNNQDGTYTIVYTVVVVNDGDVELRNVQLDDGLQAVWGGSLLGATASTVGPCTDATTLPYDGVTNTLLWEGTDTMFAGAAGPPGDTCTVTITATVTADSLSAAPAALDTDYTNTAAGSGTSPGGTPAGDRDTATTQISETPMMGVTKALTSGPDNNGDGTYDLDYTITVANTGDVELRNVQTTDGLLAVFGGALVSGTAAAPTGTGGCTAPAAAYDGTTNTNLLAGTDTIAVGASCEIIVSVVASADSDGAAPAALNTDFTNTATGSSTSPSGAPVGGTDDATTQFTEMPGLDVVKSIADEPVNNEDGTYTIEYTLDIANTGDVELRNFQTEDGLSAVWGAGLVSGTAVSTGACTDSAAPYDGTVNTNLLTGTDTLSVGASCQVVITAIVTVDTDVDGSASLDTDYTNTATGDGDTPAGGNVSDSDDAVTQVSEMPAFDLVKTITDGPTNNEDGTYTIEYTIDIENTGDVELRDVQVTDGLQAVWGGALTSATGGVAVGACTTATTLVYDGITNLNLLEGTDTMAVGDTCSIVVTAIVSVSDTLAAPAALDTDYENTADGGGVSPGGESATDADTAVTQVSENPGVDIVKTRTGGPINNEDGTWGIQYTLDVTNTGNVELHDLQVQDGLVAVFGNAIQSAVAATTGPCTDSTTPYDGVTNIDLLTGLDILPVDGVCAIVIDVTVTVDENDPDAAQLDADYTNLAAVTGDSPSGAPQAAADDETTSLGENPAIEVTKAVVGEPVNNGDGTHTVTYQILASNMGDVELRNVQVDDGLETVFGAGNIVSAATTTAAPCSTNPGYTGSGAGTGLLSGTDTIPVSSVCDIALTVTVTPGTNLGPYTNTADASGTSPGGEGVAADDPADVTFVENPAIDVVKTVSQQPASNLDGTFDMKWEVVVENTGDIVLHNVQLADDMAAALGTTVGWTVTGTALDAADTCSLASASPYTGSAPDTLLLDGTDSLVIGETCTITIDVTLEPGLALGPHTNTVDANGTSPGGASVTDTDDAPVTVIENPAIDIVKTIKTEPVNDGTGIFTMTYEMITTNTGDVPLYGVQVTDDLAAAFAGVASWSEVATVTAGGCNINPGFDGTADMNLLLGLDAVAVEASCTIEIEVTFDPEGVLGTYTNAAGTSGTSPGGEGVSDADSTDEEVEENPQISLTKDIVSPGIVNNQDFTYDLTYAFVVTNSGDVPLNGAQVTDDLTGTFAAAAGFSVAPGAVSVTAGACVPNPAFDGSADTNLLAGTDRLVVGASCTVQFTVTVTPGATLGVYDNTADATGTSPAGEGVSDVSHDGADADPESDGPGDNSDPTPATFPENPQISLTKDIIDPPAVVNNQDGTYTLTYRLVATNTGDVPLLNAQIVDDMSATYATATSWSVAGTSQPNLDPCTTSVSYDGSPDTALLAGTDTMLVGAVCTVDIEILVTPGADLGPYNNSATASGTSPGGQGVDDISQDGTDPDPEGDGPGDNSDQTPAWFTEAPQISLAKSLIGGPTNNGDGTYAATYQLDVANSGNIILYNVQVNDDMSLTYAPAISWIVDASRVTSGACTSATTVAYDGSPATGLLEGTDAMAVGDTCTLEIDVTFEPGSFLGAYDNTATADGTSPAGDPVSDISQDGDDADPEGDGPADNSDTTRLSVGENPSIDLTKVTADGPTNNMDGTYTLTWGLTLTNTGDIEVRDAQITDDIATTLSPALSWTLDDHAVTAGPCTDSTTFDGIADLGLLAGTDTLAIGDVCELDITVTVTPGEALGGYTNVADATAVSPAGASLNDVDDEDTTFTENPLVDIQKDIVSGPTNDGTGVFTSVYELVITNTGDVALANVQVSDDLSVVYEGVASWTATSAVTGGICADNPTPFDGDANPNLLAGTDTLPVIFTCTMQITVIFDPGADLGDYVNTASVTGTSPAGADATDADDASGMAEENPQISLSKDIVAAPVNNNDGSYSLTYGLVVTNTGDVPLNNAQVDDSLAATFADATAWQVDGTSVTAGDCTAAVTTPFDGDAAPGLLEGTDMMAVADTCTITIDVTVTPGADLGAYDNTATASGTSPAGEGVDDISQDGAEADTDGDGDPGNNSDPTPVWFTEEPQISLTKDILDGPVNNGDGTYGLTYGFVVANSGNVALADAQVDDDLSATFTEAASFVVTPGSVTVTAGDCSASASFDGVADTGMLAGTDTMAITDTCTMTFEVTVTPGTTLGDYNNTATASGTSPAGDGVDDISQDGAEADPEGDGPGDNSDPTPVEFPENPGISLTKETVAGPVNNQDGSYSLTYGLVATNTGDVPLAGVQVDDNLDTTFATASIWIVTATSVTAGDCSSSTSYNGLTDIGTLAGTDSMAVGAACSISIDVTIVPGAEPGPFDNTATAGGTSPGGTAVSDISQDGAEADPDGDGDPSNDSDPTPVSFSENPEISLTKDIVDGPTNRGDGTFDLTYGLVVTNTGDVPLAGVQVSDDLSVTWADATSWAAGVVTVTAGDCVASTTFDGSTDTGLLAGTDGLTVGESCTVTVALEVVPGADLGPYDNSATADGTSPAGTDVSDISQDGIEADPDGDGDPSNNSDPTPAWFTEEPATALTKDLAEGPTSNGDGTYDLVYSMVLANTGNVPLTGVQLNDTLSEAFADATSFDVKSHEVASGVCTASTTYDGVSDTGLLSGDDVLSTSDSCTVEITVVVTPGAELGPYNNSATVAAATSAGALVSDVSQDGDDEDPDGDNDAGNNSDPTPAEFPIDPSIALSKRVADGPTLISGSNYSLTYRLNVANTGDTALADTQVEDKLATTFAAAKAWTVEAVTVSNGDCTASTTFNGDSDAGLLSGTDTLATGTSCVIDVKVTVDVGTADGNFENTATATGNGPGGAQVTDVSQDGADADPNGDGDATDNNVLTKVLVKGVSAPPPLLAFVAPTPTPVPQPVTPLALTGANSLRMAALAVAMLGFGATLVLGARRRRED